MADTNVTLEEAVPVEDVEIDMEAKAKEYDTQTRVAGNEYRMTTDVKNFSKRLVHVVETHFWHGRTLTNFPNLAVNTGAAMRQAGTLPEGVKWGITYADGDQASNRKFIVAVHGPTGKIYVESGPIGPVDWNVIEVKLDRHSGNKADITDPIFGARIVAEISGTYAVAKFYN
ncbi:uncharacterized protein LOC110712849 [Chenopodium quinoa]|uniref:Uncharacterized protein n=1 Tax=Chenopodium quinoa TaxID=63459 RepID=A0A803N5I3_CHEQI|nr:uncharacterized protein LOC110712849 [Chenopodium quinoa]